MASDVEVSIVLDSGAPGNPCAAGHGQPVEAEQDSGVRAETIVVLDRVWRDEGCPPWPSGLRRAEPAVPGWELVAAQVLLAGGPQPAR